MSDKRLTFLKLTALSHSRPETDCDLSNKSVIYFEHEIELVDGRHWCQLNLGSNLKCGSFRIACKCKDSHIANHTTVQQCWGFCFLVFSGLNNFYN